MMTSRRVLMVIALCVFVAPAVFGDEALGATVGVTHSCDPAVPGLECLSHLYIGLFLLEDNTPLKGATVTLSAPHGGIFTFKPLTATTDSVGFVYGDFTVSKLSGEGKITLRITMSLAGWEGAIDYEQPVSSRMPYIGTTVWSGSVNGSYLGTYDTSDERNYMSLSYSSGQEATLPGSGQISSEITGPYQGVDCWANVNLYNNPELGKDSGSISIVEGMTKSHTARIAYTGEGIIPSKVVVRKSLTPSARMDAAYSCQGEGDIGVAKLDTRVTITSPLFPGQSDIDCKRSIGGLRSEEIQEVISPGTSVQDRVTSGEVAVSNASTASIACLISADVETSDEIIATASIESNAESSISVMPYSMLPFDTNPPEPSL